MDEKTLDEILPIPEVDELENQIKEDLKESKSIISNFANGGIFKTIIMIFFQIYIEIVKLIRKIVPGLFLSDAKGMWLDIKAADYGKTRNLATYTKGYVTLKRQKLNGVVKVPKDYIFKTNVDANGKEYKFIVIGDTYMQDYENQMKVLVRAEKQGVAYNVPAGAIKNTLQHIEGIDEIINEEDWLVEEGADEEDDESLRERCYGVWDELATQPTGGKYKTVASDVTGVIDVLVDDMHPRGQGTIDLIITGTAGAPTQALIDAVTQAVSKIEGPYDNVLIYGPTIVNQDIDVTLYVDALYGDDENITLQANQTIQDLFVLKKGVSVNKFYKAKLSHDLMNIDHVENVKINIPIDDVILEPKNLLRPGTITINIARV